MKPRFKIQINEPCHENWNEMSATAKGKFCEVCSKNVVDFTSYSDDQLIEYFSNRKNGYSERLCGRFNAEKVIVPQKIEVHETSYYQLKKGWERFLWLLLVSLGFVVVSCSDNAVKGEIVNQQSVKQSQDSEVILSKQPEILGNIKPKNDSNKSVKSKKVQNCRIVQPPVELMGEPMDVMMGGISVPNKQDTPVIIKGEAIIGDTIIIEQPQRTIKGKVAMPQILPKK